MKVIWEISVSDSVPSQFAFDSVEIFVKKICGQNVETVKHTVSTQYYATNNFLNKIHQKTVNGHAFTDFFKSDNGDWIWQFMPAFAWPEFNRIIKLNEGFETIFSDEKPDKISLHAKKGLSNYYVYLLLEQHAKKMGIPLAFKSGLFSVLSNKLSNSVISILCKHIVRKIYFGLRKKNSKKEQELTQYDAIFLTYGKRYFSFDEDGSLIKDSNFNNAISAINAKKKMRTLIIDLDDSIQYTMKSAEGYTAIPLSAVNNNWSINSFFTFITLLGKNIKAYSSLNRVCRAAKNTDVFGAFRPVLKRLLFDYSFIVSDELRKAESLVNRYRPSLIGMTYETGTMQRAITIRARTAGIRTYGFQHGMIFDNHYDYCHTGVAANAGKSWHFAIPDILFVWGDFWKSVLKQKFSYPDERVEVSGYPKVIPQSPDPVQAVNGMVGIFSNYFMTAEFIKDVAEALRVKGIKDFFVKLHPTENNSETRKKISDSLMQEVRFIDNLNTAFETADIIISQYSTVISEAILYNKNVVLCDFYNLGFPEVYETFGVVVKATNTEELYNAFSMPKPFASESERRAFVHSFFGNYTSASEIIANKILSDI